MQAVIVAAGKSSRFWPLNNQHKSQIKILGKPLIYWTIKGLSEKSIKDIILVVGPNSSIKEEVSSAVQGLDVNFSFVIQEEALGTGNAIFQAKDLVKGPFFVIWAYEIKSKEIVGKILGNYDLDKVGLVLVGAKTDSPWDYGVCKLEGEKLVEIVEKPKQGQEPSDIKTLGIYFLQPDFFEYYQRIKKHHQADLIDALNLYMKDKEARLLMEKEPASLKYPWELLNILKFKLESDDLDNNVFSSASIGKNVVIEGKVHIGDNVSVGPNTVIFGPCFIGDNCKIGPSNVLRGPVNLEKDIITGSFTEIKNCLIGGGSHFHSGYFGDSLIGRNCRFGAGFVTANRRIDRANIKALVKGNEIDTGLTYFGAAVGNNTSFGIQSGTMPGKLIGSDCIIGPGKMVFENLEDGKKLL